MSLRQLAVELDEVGHHVAVLEAKADLIVDPVVRAGAVMARSAGLDAVAAVALLNGLAERLDEEVEIEERQRGIGDGHDGEDVNGHEDLTRVVLAVAVAAVASLPSTTPLVASTGARFQVAADVPTSSS